jgi:hypothetical protein
MAKKANPGVRLEYDFVKKFFEDNGCKLLSTEYKNARTHLDYICSCGNKAKIVFCSFRAGNRCRKCGNRISAEKQRFTHEQVKKYIESFGCELISEEYHDAQEKLVIRCKCGDIFEKTFNVFQQGQRVCCECSLKGRSGKNHYEWKEDREKYFEECNFRQRCYKILKCSLKKVGRHKNDRTQNLLGYSFRELQNHIKGHKNWDKVKGKKWHIDHIFPIQAFVDHKIEDMKVINALDNLRPISALENCSKGDSYDEKEFIEWLKKKGIKIDELSK